MLHNGSASPNEVHLPIWTAAHGAEEDCSRDFDRRPFRSIEVECGGRTYRPHVISVGSPHGDEPRHSVKPRFAAPHIASPAQDNRILRRVPSHRPNITRSGSPYRLELLDGGCRFTLP